MMPVTIAGQEAMKLSTLKRKARGETCIVLWLQFLVLFVFLLKIIILLGTFDLGQMTFKNC